MLDNNSNLTSDELVSTTTENTYTIDEMLELKAEENEYGKKYGINNYNNYEKSNISNPKIDLREESNFTVPNNSTVVEGELINTQYPSEKLTPAQFVSVKEDMFDVPNLQSEDKVSQIKSKELKAEDKKPESTNYEFKLANIKDIVDYLADKRKQNKDYFEKEIANTSVLRIQTTFGGKKDTRHDVYNPKGQLIKTTVMGYITYLSPADRVITPEEFDKCVEEKITPEEFLRRKRIEKEDKNSELSDEDKKSESEPKRPIYTQKDIEEIEKRTDEYYNKQKEIKLQEIKNEKIMQEYCKEFALEEEITSGEFHRENTQWRITKQEQKNIYGLSKTPGVLKHFKSEECKEIVSSYFNKPSSWFQDKKLESQVLANIIKYNDRLKALNINVNEGIKLLCTLYNIDLYINSNHKMIRVPDKVLTKRGKISHNTLFNLMRLYQHIGFINYEVDSKNGIAYYQLKAHRIKSDEYFITKCKQFWDSDINKVFKEVQYSEEFYRLPYSKKVKDTKFNRMILGITLAYNEFVNAGFEDKEILYRHRIAKESYGIDEDILYCEVPVHIIAYLFNMSDEYVTKKLNRMCKRMPYLTKHDLTYADYSVGKKSKLNYYAYNNKHYGKNVWYKKMPLNHYNSIYTEYTREVLDENHPNITANSIIIFPEVMKQYKVYKDVQKIFLNCLELVKEYYKFNEYEDYKVNYKNEYKEVYHHCKEYKELKGINPLLFNIKRERLSEHSQKTDITSSSLMKEVIAGGERSMGFSVIDLHSSNYEGITEPEYYDTTARFYPATYIRDRYTGQKRLVARGIESVCEFMLRALQHLKNEPSGRKSDRDNRKCLYYTNTNYFNLVKSYMKAEKFLIDRLINLWTISFNPKYSISKTQRYNEKLYKYMYVKAINTLALYPEICSPEFQKKFQEQLSETEAYKDLGDEEAWKIECNTLVKEIPEYRLGDFIMTTDGQIIDMAEEYITARKKSVSDFAFYYIQELENECFKAMKLFGKQSEEFKRAYNLYNQVTKEWQWRETLIYGAYHIPQEAFKQYYLYGNVEPKYHHYFRDLIDIKLRPSINLEDKKFKNVAPEELEKFFNGELSEYTTTNFIKINPEKNSSRIRIYEGFNLNRKARIDTSHIGVKNNIIKNEKISSAEYKFFEENMNKKKRKRNHKYSILYEAEQIVNEVSYSELKEVINDVNLPLNYKAEIIVKNTHSSITPELYEFFHKHKFSISSKAPGCVINNVNTNFFIDVFNDKHRQLIKYICDTQCENEFNFWIRYLDKYAHVLMPKENYFAIEKIEDNYYELISEYEIDAKGNKEIDKYRPKEKEEEFYEENITIEETQTQLTNDIINEVKEINGVMYNLDKNGKPVF